MTGNPVISVMTDPWELEKYYREDPIMFGHEFELARRIHPQSQILKFWQARLEYPEIEKDSSVRPSSSQLAWLVVLCLGRPYW